jgi:histidyl-tRNA synthetase
MKPSIPQGTRDFGPAVVKKRQYILESIKKVFSLYGYQPLETPSMENLQTLTGKYGDEGDKLMFKILNNGLDNPDKKEKVLAGIEKIMSGKIDMNITERALRYDLTIPFARYVAMNHNDLALPFKRYQMQPVWRADRPQKGRYREFWQCDADVVGSNSLINEAELLAIYRQAFHNLKVPGVTIKLNSRKILAGLANAINASDKLVDMTVAIDKLDKIQWEGVEKELINRSFTPEQITTIQAYINIPKSSPENMIKGLKEILGDDEMTSTGIQELEQTLAYHKILEKSDWANDIALDFTLARGLNYYTGIIVEVTTNAVAMGSIGGGGRYDDLTGLFGLKGISGVGVSFGIDRIYDVMEQLNIFPKHVDTSIEILFLNIDSNYTPQILKYVSDLRAKNISCEIYADVSKIDKQLKYANKRTIKWVGIVGSEEANNNVIKLKNMETGEQQAVSIDEIITILKH